MSHLSPKIREVLFRGMRHINIKGPSGIHFYSATFMRFTCLSISLHLQFNIILVQFNGLHSFLFENNLLASEDRLWSLVDDCNRMVFEESALVFEILLIEGLCSVGLVLELLSADSD